MDFPLNKLNAEQKKAVLHEFGPLLIVAGAGTGKTTVLINRLAHLILNKGLATENILLITFTEKAAAELEERADQILPYGYVDLWIHTFHGFAERLLRDHALDIGLSSDFRLLSSTEQWVLIKRNLDLFELDYYRPLGNPTKFISELLRHFSRLKDENISSEEYLSYVEELETDFDNRLSGAKVKTKEKKIAGLKERKKTSLILDQEIDQVELSRLKELAQAYHTYNRLLLEENVLDFGDLIVYGLKLLRSRPKILNYYRQQFRQIMVDEFQDTNWAQYELIKLLLGPENNLTVVGDDDQSVYKFRGASLSNIMQFKDDFPQATEVILTENYRSNQKILDCAYKFISNNNPNRLEIKLGIDKSLVARSNNPLPVDGAITCQQFDSWEREVFFVGQEIADRFTGSWQDFAILVRANDTAEFFTKELNRRQIPNQFVSMRGLYYKTIVLDCLAYLRLLDNYHESSALFRVLNMKAFKVNQTDLIMINRFAQRKVFSLFEALNNAVAIPGLQPASLENISRLLGLISKHSNLAATEKPSRLLVNFIYDSGLAKSLDYDQDQEDFSYLNQLYSKIKKFEDTLPDARLKDFMESFNLELAAGDTGSLRLDFSDPDSVKIMTVHAAKGLEFKTVFLVDVVDKKFPTINRGERISIPDRLVREKGIPGAEAHLEEERRLFYVALTRAKDKLFITGSKDHGGVREKKVSRFIGEAGLEMIEEIDSLKKIELARELELFGDNDQKVLEEKLVLPDKFSFSQLAAFDTCPLQYKFAFILKIPAPADKPSLIFGRVMHSVLYDFLSPLSGNKALQADLFGKMTSPDLSLERLQKIFVERWQPDGYHNKEEREKYLKKGQKALLDFWQYFQGILPRDILFLEKRFSFKIGKEIMKGAIDRVDCLPDGTLEVVDYKTGQPKEEGNLDYNAKKQLVLYQIFLEEFLSRRVSKLTYYYLESGEAVSFTTNEKEMEKLKAQISEQIAAIRKGEFPPKPSLMCQYCDFNTICEFSKIK